MLVHNHSGENYTRRREFRPDIQGLRAISVLSVVVFHFFSSKLPGGFVGVDIFFVISGYLIPTIIFRDIIDGNFTFTKFYERRIRRLFPALFLVLFATIVIAWKSLLPSEFISLMYQIIFSALFCANIFFYLHINYFIPSDNAWPLLHLWSLGVEEQFYILFPILCIIFFRWPWNFLRIFTLLAIFALSFAINICMVNVEPTFDFYMPFTRFWEFFFGVAISYGEMLPSTSEVIRNQNKYFSSAITLTGGGMVLASLFLIHANEAFPGYVAIFPCLGAGLLILARGQSRIGSLVLSNRLSVFIGSISYPLYLWHWPLLTIARAAAGTNNISDRQKLPLLAISFLFAIVTYFAVEKPISRLSLTSYGKIVVKACVGAVGAVGLFAVYGIARSGFPQRFSPVIVALDHNYVADMKVGSVYKSCFLERDQPASSFSTRCENITDTMRYKYSVLVWGDSHAADLMSGLVDNMHGSSLRIMQYTSSFCAPIIGYHDPDRPLCFDTNNAIEKKIEGLHPDIVILSALWPIDKSLYPLLVRTINLLKTDGVKSVFVIGPAPQWKYPVVYTLEHSLITAPDRPIENMLPRTEMTQTDDIGLQSSISGTSATYISIEKQLCSTSACRVADGPGWQHVITFDSGHFTPHGSDMVMRFIAPIIRIATP